VLNSHKTLVKAQITDAVHMALAVPGNEYLVKWNIKENGSLPASSCARACAIVSDRLVVSGDYT